MPYTAYNSVSKMGLAVSGGAVKEQYIPLWVSSALAITTSTSPFGLIEKGSTGTRDTAAFASDNKLHTLSPSWSSTQKFALEVSIKNNTSGAVTEVALFDLTSVTATEVTSSSITLASQVYTVIRSASFILTPGHTYGVGIRTLNMSTFAYLNKAHLVAIN